jgi:poly(hydroxyalkanoate) depolymerase family esterase
MARMRTRAYAAPWAKAFKRGMAALNRSGVAVGQRVVARAIRASVDRLRPPPGDGDWIAGVVMGLKGARRYRLYRPPDMQRGERLPLVVMLHGCGQDARSFAESTRMNRVAARERFMVLYPEQDRLANAQGCWNWFDTDGGGADGDVALIMKAIDQVCSMYAIDPTHVAVAGLSAGASMAALLATRHPARFKALIMHSGIPPGTAHSGMSALGAMHGRRRTQPLAASSAPMATAWPPLLVIHGEADAVVSPSNGRAAVRIWADAADAKPSPLRTVQRGQRYPMGVTDFKRRGRTVATLVEVGRLGHAWSGGAPGQPFGDGQGPDASRMVWAFAVRQFRAAA